MNAAKKLDNSGEMNVKEAAQYISERLRRPFSVKTLYNYASIGQGPACKVVFGRNVYIAPELDAWIERHTIRRRAFSR